MCVFFFRVMLIWPNGTLRGQPRPGSGGLYIPRQPPFVMAPTAGGNYGNFYILLFKFLLYSTKFSSMQKLPKMQQHNSQYFLMENVRSFAVSKF